jgi:hypothetical protein
MLADPDYTPILPLRKAGREVTLEAGILAARLAVNHPVALVCQDGQEGHTIPWDDVAAVFIGGSTEWKMSQHAARIIKAAQLLGKHTHVGRINTPQRFAWFNEIGVDTCDGSGASKYDWMLDAISDSLKPRPLLEAACAGA